MKLRIAFLTLAMAAAVAASAQTSPAYVNGVVLVKFRPGYTVAAQAASTSIGATQAAYFPQIGVSKIALRPGMTVSQAVNFYRSKSFVQYVEPNYVRHWSLTPNDPMFGNQYHHQRIETPQAWDLNTGSTNVVIYVLDSGVDSTHPDLVPNLLPGYDFVGEDPIPEDNVGHGTHVSGCASAATNNSIGVAGPGFSCKVRMGKVGEAFLLVEDIVQGLTWAADEGADVINMSFGGYGASQAEQSAVNYAWSKGCVLVAAAGNDNVSQQSYPAAFPNVIAVGSTNQADQKSSFSNFGDWVDVAAPGSAILSTVVGGGYEAWDGTSMASPVAAGVAGLIWSIAGPNATNAEIRDYLENNCDFVGNWVVNGRINANDALNAVPIFVINPIGAVLPVAMQGTNTAGDAISLHNVDGDFYTMQTVTVPGLGAVMTMNASFDVDTPLNQINRLTGRANLSGRQGSTAFFYIWNYQTGRFQHFKSKPVTPNSIPVDFEVIFPTPYGRYIGSDGIVKLAIRVVGPRYAPGNFAVNMDRLELLVRTIIPRN